MTLKNEDYPKNEDDLKIEDNLKSWPSPPNGISLDRYNIYGIAMRAQKEKMTFSCKADCTLVKHTWRWTYSTKTKTTLMGLDNIEINLCLRYFAKCSKY